MNKHINRIRESVWFRILICHLLSWCISAKKQRRWVRFSEIEIFNAYVKGNVVERQHVADGLDLDQYERFVHIVMSFSPAFAFSYSEVLRANQLRTMVESNQLLKLIEQRYGNKNVIRRIN